MCQSEQGADTSGNACAGALDGVHHGQREQAADGVIADRCYELANQVRIQAGPRGVALIEGWLARINPSELLYSVDATPAFEQRLKTVRCASSARDQGERC